MEGKRSEQKTNDVVAIPKAVIEQTETEVVEQANIIDLIVEDGHCIGAVGVHDDGEAFVIESGAVVLATGGVGQLFRHSFNSPGNTGDGYAMVMEHRNLVDVGETIKADITGGLMVKGERACLPSGGHMPSSHGHQLAPATLTKTLFRLPHDLCLTDSAIEPSRRIWERSGGHAIPIYSLRWLRSLKPFGFELDKLENKGRFRPLIRASKPICTLLDIASKSFLAPETTSAPEGCIIDQVQPEEIIDGLKACRRYDLMPCYSKKNLAWILRMACSRKRYGLLRSLAVRQPDHRLLVRAIYAGVPGRVDRTFQLHADPKAVDRIFDCLLHDAAENRIVALEGKVDPVLIDRLSKRRCILSFKSWTLVHARNPNVIQAFLSGKALFSELESEGWTGFVNARPKQEFAVA